MVPGTSTQVVPVENICSADEPKVLCIIKDETDVCWQNSKQTVNLPVSTTVKEFLSEVAKKFSYEEDSFTLSWRCLSGKEEELIPMNNLSPDKTLGEYDLATNNRRNNFLLQQKDGLQPVKIKTKEDSDEDVESESLSSLFDSNTSLSSINYSTPATTQFSPYNSTSYGILSKSDTGFVGLVNQAMTCYLNSLLQTLYMTPEFRNAIYKWEFNGSDEEETKSIPYQLQKLFVQLQTSHKKAVETTDITKSFGWDSSEAWQQHDVQELCRVMFDALEKNFKNTDQADLINKLYQGKMKDYVKCLECGNESARVDTYLDIPLAIRPFGSDDPYNSVEEAMNAFVQPETLDGSNQYFCEKCNKKCDAHKGLKFMNFPYLLTLQLMRFAFDYQTLHRIKLNDRMTFPKVLNLNTFITDEEDSDGEELNIKGSDSQSSTETDSGVSEGCSDNGTEDEDILENGKLSEATGHSSDGVDMDVGNPPDDLLDDPLNDINPDPKGKYTYELFSVMIHSGSASGGHYYAYIKSFSDGQWYCFNDQSVTKISDEDLRRSFGGVERYSRSYYSAAYSSSVNGYMLMYRRIDPSRNCCAIEVENMPSHITRLIDSINSQEEHEKRQREIDRSTCKIKLFCQHPLTHQILERKLEVHKDKTLTEATEQAHKLLGLEGVLPVEQCRLVKYDEFYQSLEKSYEGEEETPIMKILGGVKQSYMFDLLLETRDPDEQFEVYKSGGTTVKVYPVDLSTNKVGKPCSIRAYLNNTVQEFKQLVSQKTGMPVENMRVALEKNHFNEMHLLDSPNKTLKSEGFYKCNKVFVECTDPETDVLFEDSKFSTVLETFANTIVIQLELPSPDVPCPPVVNGETGGEEDVVDQPVSETAKVVNVDVDKRLTLAEFKTQIEPLVGCSAENFKVFRVYSNNQEMECVRLSETMATFTTDTKVIIRYGRALKKGEYRIKVFQLLPSESEPTKYLTEWIVAKESSVLDTKQALAEELKTRFQIDIPVNRLRLRKKTWKTPSTVLLDSQVFDKDIPLYTNWEVFVEELQEPEKMKDSDKLQVYVRQWRPSQYKVEPFQEVILDQSTVAQLKERISEISQIPEERVEFAKGKGTFPSEVSVLDVHTELDWNPDVDQLTVWPLFICDDGCVIYYRDKDETLMELSEEKKKEIQKSENARLRTNHRSTYIPQKERALKIYTDHNPKPASPENAEK